MTHIGSTAMNKTPTSSVIASNMIILALNVSTLYFAISTQGVVVWVLLTIQALWLALSVAVSYATLKQLKHVRQGQTPSTLAFTPAFGSASESVLKPEVNHAKDDDAVNHAVDIIETQLGSLESLSDVKKNPKILQAFKAIRSAAQSIRQ